VSFIEALSANHHTRAAANAAETGTVNGILSPTEVLIEGSGVAQRKADLLRLQQALAHVPGVAVVIGAGAPGLPEDLHVFDARDNGAGRFLLVLSDEPLGARAVDTVARLNRELPGLVRSADPQNAHASLGGDTAIAQALVDQTE
jgi:RND superfamily putative drug exporter